MARKKDPWGKLVLVEFEDGIAWVTMNRPEKRNAMSPALNEEMRATVEALASDERCNVLILSGAGDSFANARVCARNCASGTASLTRPISAALRPSKVRPVRMYIIALRRFIVATAARVTLPAGMMPQFTSDSAKVASLAAIARSHATTGVNAPPKHQPFTMAIVAFG